MNKEQHCLGERGSCFGPWESLCVCVCVGGGGGGVCYCQFKFGCALHNVISWK